MHDRGHPGMEDGVEGTQSVFSTMIKEFNNFRDREKQKMDDEDMLFSPFAGIEKSTVLQEAKAAFNDPHEVKHNPGKCCLLISKLLFLLAQGETFSGNDTTDVFFAVTKLFQSKDVNLRRMTYLFLKEVAESTDSEDIIIVISSLTKDMNSSVDLYRANAIRVLCKIIDAQMLGQIDRYIRQAVVDRNALVSSSALISGNQMAVDPQKREIVRRWVNEVQEAVNSRSEMVQYHALSLLYTIKCHDRLAIGRLVTQFTRSSPMSPLAVCLLVRYTSRLLHDDLSATNAQAAYGFLESCLRHKNEMVIYEAARAMCRLPEVAARDILPSITVLQLFLSSPKPTLRFAAVRTLNEVAIKHPGVVAKCNEDMEGLIGDSNRSIATLAITTLLKTGSESSVDRLMKQIQGFISDIADEFKIVVVQAVRALCLKFNSKARVLLNFLSNILREEGGFEFKKVIVDTMLELIERIPETKRAALFHLCEFIEDCEFTQLSARILHLLGEEGPSTEHPAKFIRFIYNRIILENAHVRAAAVSALGKFGAKVESLRPSIITLLTRSQLDEDDEVRDRATFCLSLLRKGSEESKHVLLDPLPIKPHLLLRSLEMYKLRPTPGALTFDSLPIVEDTTPIAPAQNDENVGLENGTAIPAGDEETKTELPQNYAEELLKIPEFADLGQLFRSVPPKHLTESETEYLVRCTKHIFPHHIVFQFDVTNTINDQLLTDVEVVMDETESGDWELFSSIPAESIPYSATKTTYVCYKTPEEGVHKANFMNELKFRTKSVDPNTGELEDPDDEGEEEEFPVDDLEMSAADLMAKVPVPNFRTAWGMIGDSAELLDKFQLPQYKSLNDAVKAVVEFLGLEPCEGTGTVPHNAVGHTVFLSGVYLGGIKVLARTLFSVSASDNTIMLKIAIRSESPDVSQLVLDCI
uniref:Coatomer subunit gamma n=1 Tax=Aplanochytrium stocchinoi TaxID=215587 RepID=A0A7S3LLT2_9STRA